MKTYAIFAAFAIALVLLVLAGLALITHGHWFLGGASIWFAVVSVLLTFNYCAGTTNKKLDEIEANATRQGTKRPSLDLYA